MQVHRSNAHNQVSSQNKAENLWVQTEEMPPVHPVCFFSTISHSCCNPFVYLSVFSFHCSPLALLLLQFSVLLVGIISLCSCESRSSFFLEVPCTSKSLSFKIHSDNRNFWQNITLEGSNCGDWAIVLVLTSHPWILTLMVYRNCRRGCCRCSVDTGRLIPTWLARPVSTKWHWSFGSSVRSTGKEYALQICNLLLLSFGVWRERDNDSSSQS